MAARNVAVVAEIIDAFNARDLDRVLEQTDPRQFHNKEEALRQRPIRLHG